MIGSLAQQLTMPGETSTKGRMSIPAIHNLRGGPLVERDYQALVARCIDREWADWQMLRRVISIDGGEILGRNGAGDYAGVAIPYIWPGDSYIREYRVRRDNPEYEDGKPKQKYMAPPGRGNLLYLPVGIEPAWLTDTAQPIVLTEGEFKAIALMRTAWYGLGASAERPRFFAVGISGVWNWRGVIGKVTNEDGARVDEKGPIPDLARIVWKDRTTTIVFDRDVDSNESVRIARNLLARELQTDRQTFLLAYGKSGSERHRRFIGQHRSGSGTQSYREGETA